jgi:hypothetical protein
MHRNRRKIVVLIAISLLGVGAFAVTYHIISADADSHKPIYVGAQADY